MSEFEQYRALFAAESRECIEMLVKNLLPPESEGIDAETVGEIFRAIHTPKGASASMGARPIRWDNCWTDHPETGYS